MNIKVPLNIYGRPWLIEPNAALSLLDVWEKISSNKMTWEENQEDQKAAIDLKKLTSLNSGVVFAPTSRSEAYEFKGFEGAKTAVIPVLGPLMKDDFCGWFGTARLASLFRLADNTPSVESIVVLLDTPGGTVDGTAPFAHSLKQAKKATLGVVDEMACSAGYWLASSLDKVVATSNTSIIGSIGTMISWWDRSKAAEANGFVLREYYATKSVDKNRSYREANSGDGRMLIQESLDPINNEFLATVKANRAGKIDLDKEDVLTGKVYVGKAAIAAGLIDAIMPFEKALQYSLKLAHNKNQIKMSKVTPFQRALKAAKADSFAIVDEIGFGLTEQQLTDVESALSTAETQAADLQSQLTAAQNQQATTQASLDTANATIKKHESRIAELEKGPATTFTSTTKTDDVPAAKNPKDKYRTSYDDMADKYARNKD